MNSAPLRGLPQFSTLGVQMRDYITTAIEITGAALIVAGIALIWIPAAVMAAGAAMIAFSALVNR